MGERDGNLNYYLNNLAPDAQNDSGLGFSTDEDTPFTTPSVLGNDSDPDEQDSLSITQVNGTAVSVGTPITLASGARLTLNANGTFDYNPNGAFESLDTGETDSDSFTYTLSDGQGGSDTATVSLSIAGITDNSAPDAVNDAVSTNEDTGLNGNVLADNGNGADSDPDNDPLTVTAVNGNTGDIGQEITLASGAELTLNANGTFTYNPDANFNGNDSFTYTLSDGTSTDTATVNVTVNPISDISISDVTVNEGNVGTTNASFTVTLDDPSSQAVTVDYTTANDTAIAGVIPGSGDYNAKTGTLTFNPGDPLSQTITITVNGDLIDEANETFFVNLSNPTTDATITDDQGIGTIIDDDLANTQTGGPGPETFVTSPQTDIIDAGGGNDKVLSRYSELQQNDSIDGSTGRDTFVLSAGNSSNSVTIEVTDASDQLQGDNLAAVTNFEVFNLTNFAGSAEFIGGAQADTFYGGAGNDTVQGKDGNDYLAGNGGSDTIEGGAGNDTIDGGAGNDILKGGAGNDTYIVNSRNDQVIEDQSNGLDTVRASVSYNLSPNVGNLTLTGNSSINGTGNNISNTIVGNGANNTLKGAAAADTLLGNAGNDILAGEAGNDTLTGGGGSDKFLYDTGRSFQSADVGIDSITDFAKGSDKIVLDRTTFTALNNGFSFARVTSDGAADNSSADIVYSSTTGSSSGKLFYNTNGTANGFGSGAQFAVLTNLAAPLAMADFLVQA